MSPGHCFDRWPRAAPLGRLYTWLNSVPGAMVYNTPAFKLHEELQLHAENHVLDIGCGRGALLQLLTSRVQFRRPPVGIEVSRLMLDRAREHGSQYCRASGACLPFADGSFDVILCGHATRQFDHEGFLELLREIRRVLSPGGIAILWDFAPTRSKPLNAFHARVLGLLGSGSEVRSYTTLSAYALEAGFEWVSNAHLRPFLFPPIPRASIITGKAPIGWQPPDVAEALSPDTRARSIVAGVTRETLHEQ